MSEEESESEFELSDNEDDVDESFLRELECFKKRGVKEDDIHCDPKLKTVDEILQECSSHGFSDDFCHFVRQTISRIEDLEGIIERGSMDILDQKDDVLDKMKECCNDVLNFSLFIVLVQNWLKKNTKFSKLRTNQIVALSALMKKDGEKVKTFYSL